MNDLLTKIIFMLLLGLILYQLCKTPPIETFLNAPNIILIGNIFSDKDHTRFISIKEQIENDKNLHIGEIINIKGVYGKSKIIPFFGGWRAERKYAGGGILLDQGIHMVDLMRLFCGEFTEVKSFVSNKRNGYEFE